MSGPGGGGEVLRVVFRELGGDLMSGPRGKGGV